MQKFYYMSSSCNEEKDTGSVFVYVKKISSFKLDPLQFRSTGACYARIWSLHDFFKVENKKQNLIKILQKNSFVISTYRLTQYYEIVK